MSRSAARAGAALVAVVGLITLHAQEQLSLGGPGRVVVQQSGLGAIDRGLRDQDPPRDPRGKEGSSLAQADRSEALPYLRGSVIVKFKDDAVSDAPAAASKQVAGAVVSRSSWADFDIIDIADNADPEAMAAT